MRRALVVAQVALSLALLATGSQLVSTVRSEAVSAGTSADRLLIARFDLEPLKLQPAETEVSIASFLPEHRECRVWKQSALHDTRPCGPSDRVRLPHR